MPKFEFELADIAPIGITPVWQREVKINTKKVEHSMSQTVKASATNTQHSTAAPTMPQKATKTDDVLDEINQKPNAAKAYLKRQGR